MRRTRRSSRLGSRKDGSLSTSSEEGVRMVTRRSSGRQNKVESAYDADDDTTTSDSSPQQTSDPYEFNFTEDAPVKTKSKKLPVKAHTQKGKKNTSKQPIKMKSNATSTPVLVGQISDSIKSKSDKGSEFLVTPGVTPILPVPADDKSKESLDDSYNTPTIRRSHRKRSLCLEKPPFSLMNSFKSFNSSQGDSGIVVSPPLKKIKKTPDSDLLSPSIENEPSCKETKKRTVVKKDGPDSDPALGFKHQNKRKVLVHKTENEIIKRSKRTTSCFCFESPSSPPQSDDRATKRKTDTKDKKSSKNSYRTKKVSNSSPDSPVEDISKNAEQENNHLLTRSPTLFSDDFFSDDCVVADPPKCSKPSTKSYTSLKGKTQKFSQKQVKMSKLDCWAQEYNSQFEDIEKFELFIE